MRFFILLLYYVESLEYFVTNEKISYEEAEVTKITLRSIRYQKNAEKISKKNMKKIIDSKLAKPNYNYTY